MNNQRPRLHLLPSGALHKTGNVDHADWNYKPLLGAISRRRFHLVVSLLAGQRIERLLEIGYGSGVFLPELSRYCEQLYGIDVHQMQQTVSESLSKTGVTAQLYSASASAMPFEDAFFDCLVAVSALEFVEDLDAACTEMKRVLKPGGSLVVITPGHSPLVDFGLKILTGESAQNDYGNRRQMLLPTLLRHFAVERQLSVPAYGKFVVHLYTGLKLSA
jgi:ubiquinone/menaquinone biosynthesis C-methylase UbiE